VERSKGIGWFLAMVAVAAAAIAALSACKGCSGAKGVEKLYSPQNEELDV
jgi:hypothetical protein